MQEDISKKQLLTTMLRQVASEGDLANLDIEAVATESAAAGADDTILLESVGSGLEAVQKNREIRVDEQFALEAIVMPRFRPVVDIVGDNFARPPEPWKHLGSGKAKRNLVAALPSIGRIELPDHPSIPFGGTGFVVGEGLIMTNRHVAELFATGVGVQGLNFIPNSKAGVDFGQEVTPRDSLFVTVNKIVMMHPHWDMALLQVSGLGAAQSPLVLSTTPPEKLLDRDIAVVGYPAQDRRNDFELQMKIFNKTFDVKRLQPGKIRKREKITDHFQNSVFTVTHDASTLGGNSGSAVIDVQTGQVVGLHFGGRYLVANYAVPTFELARDNQVVDAGVNFAAAVTPSKELDDKWSEADVTEAQVDGDNSNSISTTTLNPVGHVSGGTATWTLPISISVSVGAPAVTASVCLASPQEEGTPSATGDSETDSKPT